MIDVDELKQAVKEERSPKPVAPLVDIGHHMVDDDIFKDMPLCEE